MLCVIFIRLIFRIVYILHFSVVMHSKFSIIVILVTIIICVYQFEKFFRSLVLNRIVWDILSNVYESVKMRPFTFI